MAAHQDTKYRQVPPHVLRQWWADGFVPRRSELLTHGPAVRATTNSVHPRLRARERQVGELLGLDDPTEIDAALEDLQTLFARCGFHLRAQAAQRKLVRGPRPRYSNGPTAGSPRRGSGRPSGAMNFAARQLGLGLATIWVEQTGRRPTRTFDPVAGDDIGAYPAFVRHVVAVIPHNLKAKGKGQIPSLAHFIRQSIKDLAAAQASPNEYRRRGLIEDSYWHSRGSQLPGANPSN